MTARTARKTTSTTTTRTAKVAKKTKKKLGRKATTATDKVNKILRMTTDASVVAAFAAAYYERLVELSTQDDTVLEIVEKLNAHLHEVYTK